MFTNKIFLRFGKFVLFGLFCAFMVAFTSSFSYSFSSGGCEGDCKKCHSLGVQEVKDILRKLDHPQVNVLNIQSSPLKSLWEVTVDDKGKKGIIYIDFSKKFLVPGPINIIEISSKTDKSEESIEKIKDSKKVNSSQIPLKNALVVGRKNAAKKVIVFTDPD